MTRIFFYGYKDLKDFFSLVNKELQKINELLEANKLPLNVGKTKYSLSHKPRRNVRMTKWWTDVCFAEQDNMGDY